jgi:putative peptidoglycan lipid II flippase
VSWLAYAFRLMQLPLGLFGVAIASATLPSISRNTAPEKLDEFRHTLSRSLGTVFLLTVPSSVGLVVLGQSIIGAIYQHGKFQLYDTQQTALALSFYAIGLAGYSALKVLTPAFYALRDSRTPMIISLCSILINYLAASSMIQLGGLRHAGLALSTSLVALFNFLALLWILRRRVYGIYGRELLSSFLKTVAASSVMGVAVFFSSHSIATWLGIGRLARLTDLAISIPLGLAVYYVSARLMRIPELELASQAAGGPLGRWLAARRARIN